MSARDLTPEEQLKADAFFDAHDFATITGTLPYKEKEL